jgi:hypothetical protein
MVDSATERVTGRMSGAIEVKGQHKIEFAYANRQTYGEAGEIRVENAAPGHKTVTVTFKLKAA